MLNHVAHYYHLEIDLLQWKNKEQKPSKSDNGYLIFILGLCNLYKQKSKPDDTTIFDID